MGYRSQVYLKTTTEGWVVIKKFNDSIKKKEYRPLQYATVNKSPSGFYKITFDDVKWYEDEFKDVQNFMKTLDMMTEQHIPYKYIRLGEDIDDIEERTNWTDVDMPSEIENVDILIDIQDEDTYEEVPLEDRGLDAETFAHIKEVMFELFDLYPDADDVKYNIRHRTDVSEAEYDFINRNWDWILSLWKSSKKSV